MINFYFSDLGKDHLDIEILHKLAIAKFMLSMAQYTIPEKIDMLSNERLIESLRNLFYEDFEEKLFTKLVRWMTKFGHKEPPGHREVTIW